MLAACEVQSSTTAQKGRECNTNLPVDTRVSVQASSIYLTRLFSGHVPVRTSTFQGPGHPQSISIVVSRSRHKSLLALETGPVIGDNLCAASLAHTYPGMSLHCIKHTRRASKWLGVSRLQRGSHGTDMTPAECQQEPQRNRLGTP